MKAPKGHILGEMEKTDSESTMMDDEEGMQKRNFLALVLVNTWSGWMDGWLMGGWMDGRLMGG